MRNLLLHPDNFGKYVSLQEPTVPQPGREKKEAAKPEKKAVLPAVKTEPPPEQENAAPASPTGDAEQPEKHRRPSPPGKGTETPRTF